MTSPGEDSDVSGVHAIRIPTGQSVTLNLQQECEQSDDVSVTLTVTSFEDNKEQLSDQVLQCSDTEDADPEAMVRVRRPLTCRHAGVGKGQGRTLTPGLNDPCGACREREEGTLTPVADLLMAEPLDVTEAEIEAVPFEQHFYNQWARLPREEDPDSDVTVSTRRSASVRMPSATGSLKSYTLMNAIARDKTSPIENYAGLVHYMKSGTGDGSLSSPARRGHSPSDPQRTRPGGSKSANIPGRAGDNLLPILRAKTAQGSTRSEQACHQRCCSVQTSPRDSSVSLVASGCGEDDCEFPSCEKKLSVPRFLSKKDRSLTSAGSQTKHSHHPPKSLSLNIASLLFSEEIDMKQGYRQQITQKRPRTTKQRTPTKTEDDLPQNTSTNKKKDGGDAKWKPPEMKFLEFIDLVEMKKLLVKDGRSQGNKENPGYTTERTDLVPSPSRQRLACSAAQRHFGSKAFGKLYDGQNASMSVGLPLTISAIVSSAD